jgi:hypothetical protein
VIDVHADIYTRIEVPDGPEVDITYWLYRRSDGAPLAYSEVVKRQQAHPDGRARRAVRAPGER